ncbi:MAG: hypothetical protein F4Y57_08995 [Acidobacteria bacterium]|nr:hypothetical protein [Acidobacteriota bacterium]
MAKTGAERQQDWRDRRKAAAMRDRAAVAPRLPGVPAAEAPAPAPVDLLTPRPAAEAPAPGQRYSEWADEHLIVSAGRKRGQRWKTLAWQVEPVDRAGAGGAIVVLRCASQAGKTSVALVVGAGRLLCGEPVLVVTPAARPAGSTFSRERLEPLLASPPLVRYLHHERVGGLARSSSLTYRTLSTGGSVSVAGAESPSQLAARGASCVLADEIARFPASAGREGPPIPLALERTADWRETRSVLLTSTPVLPGDAMDQWYSSGDQRHWFVSCSCGHAWSPEWKHVAADPPAIVCPECGRRYPDGPEHVNLVEGGHWRPTSDAEDPEVISYSLPRWLSAASTLRACVTDRKRAERKNTLAVWRRTCAAVPSDPDPSEVVDVSPIEARREPMDHWPPADVSIAFGGTDVQADRLEVAILGFPRDRSWSAVLAYHVIRGRPAYAEPWAKLQKVLDGAGVRLCAIDAGFEPRPVRLLAQRDRRVVPIRGMAGDGRMPIEAPAPGGKSWCHVVGADPLKRDLLQKVDSGWLRLPRAPWCTSSWLRSLTAEHEERVERAGRVVTRWVVHHRRNEAMDACLYALAVSNLVPAERTGRRRRFVRLAS